jgi:lactam utilization protein B
MQKKAKKMSEMEKMTEGKELLDGGTVAAALSKEMRLKLNSVCAKLDRPQAWVFRKALEQFLDGVAV